MSLEPGQSHKDEARLTETRVAAEAISEGDAVALDSNDELVPANSGQSEVVYGVAGYNRGEDYAGGDLVKVTTLGPVVANVAADIAGGVELAASATDGELAAGSGPKGIMSMYSEGSSKLGEEIPAVPTDYAHVTL